MEPCPCGAWDCPACYPRPRRERVLPLLDVGGPLEPTTLRRRGMQYVLCAGLGQDREISSWPVDLDGIGEIVTAWCAEEGYAAPLTDGMDDFLCRARENDLTAPRAWVI